MTIDEAIKCAELMQHDTLKFDFDTIEKGCEFGALCADALRLAKKMNEENDER